MTTNGSTVGDSDTRGQVSGQCQSCGLYTAYGAQFMMGSCHTRVVQQMAMSRIGCFGYLRHRRANATTISTMATIVPICSATSQWVHPKRGVTGRGAPRTAGLAIRAAPGPMRALRAMKMRARTTAHPRRAQPAAARSSFDQRGGRVGVGAVIVSRPANCTATAQSSPKRPTRRALPNSGSSWRATR